MPESPVTIAEVPPGPFSSPSRETGLGRPPDEGLVFRTLRTPLGLMLIEVPD